MEKRTYISQKTIFEKIDVAVAELEAEVQFTDEGQAIFAVAFANSSLKELTPNQKLDIFKWLGKDREGKAERMLKFRAILLSTIQDTLKSEGQLLLSRKSGKHSLVYLQSVVRTLHEFFEEHTFFEDSGEVKKISRELFPYFDDDEAHILHSLIDGLTTAVIAQQEFLTENKVETESGQNELEMIIRTVFNWQEFSLTRLSRSKKHAR